MKHPFHERVLRIRLPWNRIYTFGKALVRLILFSNRPLLAFTVNSQILKHSTSITESWTIVYDFSLGHINTGFDESRSQHIETMQFLWLKLFKFAPASNFRPYQNISQLSIPCYTLMTLQTLARPKHVSCVQGEYSIWASLCIHRSYSIHKTLQNSISPPPTFFFITT